MKQTLEKAEKSKRWEILMEWMHFQVLTGETKYKKYHLVYIIDHIISALAIIRKLN